MFWRQDMNFELYSKTTIDILHVKLCYNCTVELLCPNPFWSCGGHQKLSIDFIFGSQEEH